MSDRQIVQLFKHFHLLKTIYNVKLVTPRDKNQSAAGAGGLGIIRGKKV